MSSFTTLQTHSPASGGEETTVNGRSTPSPGDGAVKGSPGNTLRASDDVSFTRALEDRLRGPAGYAVVKLGSARTAATIQRVAHVTEELLAPMCHVRNAEATAPSGSLWRHDSSAVVIEACRHSDRGQLRHRIASQVNDAITTTDPKSCDLTDENAASTLLQCHKTLEMIASIGLAAVAPANIETCYDKGTGILDCFYYDGQSGAEPALPGHTDPGLITVVTDNGPGLEVYEPGTGWIGPIILASDEVVVLVGRSLAALSDGELTACRHRVGKIRSPRLSIVYEIRTNVVGLQMTQRKIADALPPISSVRQNKAGVWSALSEVANQIAARCHAAICNLRNSWMYQPDYDAEAQAGLAGVAGVFI